MATPLALKNELSDDDIISLLVNIQVDYTNLSALHAESDEAMDGEVD
jgi:hypothetical protein